MSSDLPPLTWSTFWSTWHLEPGWLAVLVVLAVSYLVARGRAVATTVAPWRVASFLVGLALLWFTVSSGIGGYAMALFWMHMIMHLLLIMVIPALLVLGHPLTALVEGSRDPERARAVLRSWPFAALLSPATGVVAYTVVIVGTHLTSFMDHMAMSSWLMGGEQVVYVVAGWLFLTPLIGEEPIRSDLPYLGRLGLLVLAMVPDTLVGIVLLQSNHDPNPMYSAMRPGWALDATRDAQTAGGLMWAGGDGGMMLIAIGLIIAVITSPRRRDRMTGDWLEGARRANMSANTGTGEQDLDPDSDEALAAYNEMLARLHRRES